jgi:hypothetical protein
MRALSTERDMIFSIFPGLRRPTKSKEVGSRTGVLRIRARRQSPSHRSASSASTIAVSSSPTTRTSLRSMPSQEMVTEG